MESDVQGLQFPRGTGVAYHQNYDVCYNQFFQCWQQERIKHPSSTDYLGSMIGVSLGLDFELFFNILPYFEPFMG